jgi:SAM-dependent methyltransferase
MSAIGTGIGDPVLWHEAECGGYAADLPIWARLASAGGAGTVLDLGSGSGRVSLHLARRGFDVLAVDSDPVLIEALRAKAAAEGLRVRSIAGDVRELGGVPIRVATVIAPMQLLHLMGGAEGRLRLLAGLLTVLEPGGRFHAALLADMPALGSFVPEPMPDVRESEGMWVHASTPLAVEIDEGGLDIVRLRQLVSPDGTLTEEHNVVRLERLEAGRLEAEAEALGWEILERTPVGETEDHVASEIVSLEAPT